MALAFIFAAVCVLSFLIIALMLRPTQDQKALARRIVVIGSQRTEAGTISSDLEQYLKTQTTGSFSWLEAMLKDGSLTRSLQLLILQANSKTTVGTVVMKGLGFGTVAFLIAFVMTHMVLAGLAAAIPVSLLPVLMLRLKKNRRVNAFNNVLADCIDMISRSLRAGHSLPASIGIVAEQAAEPARSEFAEVGRQQNFGLPLRDALSQLLDRVPSQDLRAVVTGILVQKDTGGNLAEVLDRVGEVIRDRVRIQGEIRTHTAQGRMTGWVLCALPIVMLLLINLVNPGYSTPLFKDPLGQKFLYAGVALLITGGLIIRKIIRGIEI